MKIVLSTKNEGKIREIKSILQLPGVELLTFKDFEEWPSIVEDGSTFEENAIKKAKEVAKAFKFPAVADDSGLEVDFLDGKPGIFSSRYSGGGDKENIKKLLKELEGVPLEERKARFRCVADFCTPEGDIITSEGVCEGYIALSPRGGHGFGYDHPDEMDIDWPDNFMNSGEGGNQGNHVNKSQWEYINSEGE